MPERGRRRRPVLRDELVNLSHGAGGKATRDLVEVLFLEELRNEALAPLGDAEVADFVAKSPAARALESRHGRPAGDIAALTSVVQQVARLAWWLREDLAELDVNPVRVFSEGNGCTVLDALAVRHASTPAHT